MSIATSTSMHESPMGLEVCTWLVDEAAFHMCRNKFTILA